ncbi:lectin like domain-containing protein [Methanobrevibacter sp.]|uniref:lectin like domain-containing protein n=1 Tax=Methanobrevibacter sp. TaxID=66852 RepID=UPI00388EF9FE
MSAVNANDLNLTADINEELISSDAGEVICENQDPQTAGVQKTFIDLDKYIKSNEGSEIYLNHDYAYNPEFDIIHNDGIILNHAVTIWGNGHTIDGSNAAKIFDVKNKNIIFRDIIFINGKTDTQGGAITGKCSAENCTFIGNTAGYGGATYSVDCLNCTFSENTAKYNGGAGCGGSFVNCIFTRNSAQHLGGAIYTGSNMEKYTIKNCSFTDNRANVGGAVNIQFSEYAPVENCRFTNNTATWEAGAIYNVVCNNCTFTQNSADYGGAMKYGSARNCTFSENNANFGGASYQGTCINCTFTENYADYGGAIYEGFITEYCRFTGNYAFYGGAMYGYYLTPENCRFKYNYAQSGGATYEVEIIDSYFEYNAAIEYGGAMYGGSATRCTFKSNNANISGNDTFNTELINSSSSHDGNIIYFDANAEYDGNGSKSNPYKYLYADRIRQGSAAYFADGTYELNDSCTIINGAKLVGEGSNVIISSKVSNQYDFIIKEESYLILNRLLLNNIRILNQATLQAKDCNFEGKKEFDLQNPHEIETGSGIFDSTYGGIITCDTPESSKTALILEGCTFQNVHNAFNGGTIAAINSKISIRSTRFLDYSSTYKGGAIYIENCDLNMYNAHFTPYIYQNDEDYGENRYTSYYGGSIYSKNSNIFIDRCGFSDSISFSFGGCIASLNSNITVRESNFNNSISKTDGGGAIYNSKSELHIFNSKFNNNTAEFGGAICNLDSILNSYQSTYSNNHANYYGGAIYDTYGTIDYFTNRFYTSHALAGGSIYTRTPNNFIMVENTFGNSFAKEGQAIFYDGKQGTISNYYSTNYHVFAEFRATLNGEDYYIISNPLYYRMSSEINPDLYFPYPVYEVNDDLVTMMIYGTDDASRLTSISNHHKLNNISIDLTFSDQLTNPRLNVYLFEDLDILLYNKGLEGNLYTGSRDKLFREYNLIENYSIDLSNKVQNGNYNFTEALTIDFGNPYVNIKHDNLYEATSFKPANLVNSSIVYLTPLPSQIEVLSSYYNSNDYGFVSSVKDQKTGGNCWAFSGLATLETCLSKATGIKYDFSTENAKNLMSAYSVYGIKIETNYAGYDSMLLSYLTSWLGPVDESKDTYDDYSSISILENPLFHIQNVKFLPGRTDSRDNTAYKLAIKDNGAVSVTFRWGNDYHSVSLVGWDDNYTGYDSLGNPSKGAWIFKNSWGAEWENNGFGYLSYYEKISEEIYPNLHAYTFIFNDNNPYTKIYQYDFAGVSEFYHYMDTISFKNTFKADNDSILSAFSTYFDRQTNFTVMVYKNGEFIFTQNGTSPAGYYTIPFNTVIQLDEGDEFTIAINNHNKGYNCIPVCSAEEITKKTFSQNVSFISLDGETWFDLYDYADSCNVACIKAFTQNINLTDIRIKIDEFDTVNTNNFNIRVEFSDVDMDFINYCLVKFIIDNSTYYGQIRNGVANLNINLEDGQHTLSAQYRDNLFESNIVSFSFTVKKNDEDVSFNAIQDLINNAKDTVSLDRDYFYSEKFDDREYGVHVNRTLTVNGAGHVINGLGKATGFYISADNVVLNDIIFNNTLSSNGGGIFIAARNVTLNNCSFINSHALQNGGGIYSLFDVSLNNCRFLNNSANMGGGLYLIASKTTTIRNSIFEANTADKYGSAVYMEGLGNVMVTASNFTGNAARSNGGAVRTSVYSNSFEKCLFKNNSAISGGAVFSKAYVNEFINCRFERNSVNNSGGAINAHNTINIYDSDFISNSVSENDRGNIGILGGYGGGAIISYDNMNIYRSNFINNSAASDSGGALYTSKFLNVYDSQFINNTAPHGEGAVYNTELQMIKSADAIWKFAQSRYYNSIFIGNHANNGGAIYGSDLIVNCTFTKNSAANIGGALYGAKIINSSKFINNSAKYAGAVYYNGMSEFYIFNSDFTRNHAQIGGAIYSEEYENYNSGFISNTIINSSRFANNSADDGGGSICSMGILNVYNSEFENNSAPFGGAIYSENELNITESCFSDNMADTSGGAIYMGGEENHTVMKCEFINNTANFGGSLFALENAEISSCLFKDNTAHSYGGAIDFYENGTYTLTASSFKANSANYGGAVYIYAGNEEIMAYLNVSECNFTQNNALRSGGAFYTDARTQIESSSLINNTARWGSAMYCAAYIYVDKTNITSSQDIPAIEYSYHYSDDKPAYGKLDLKNNTIDVEGKTVHYNVNGVDSDTKLYLVFADLTTVKGQNVSVCRMEDADGDAIYVTGFGKLNITLTDQSNNRIQLLLNYSKDYEGFYLDTTSLDYGTYSLSGTITNDILKYSVKTAVLQITDEFGRTAPAILASSLVKVYGKGDKLTITLKDTNGNVISDAPLSVKLNGKTSILVTDSNGRDSMNVNLVPKTYYAHISFEDNGYYTSAHTTVKITIKKATPKLTAKKKTFKTKSKKYTVTLKNNLGKAMKKVKVTVKVKGKTYTAKTNSKGKATFKLKLTKKGTFKATVTYKGNKYYNKVTKKVKITVK